MKRSLAVAIALASALPATALAHKAWLQPSQTVIAGTNPWITVDAAVSNDLFYFNPFPCARKAWPSPHRMAARSRRRTWPRANTARCSTSS